MTKEFGFEDIPAPGPIGEPVRRADGILVRLTKLEGGLDVKQAGGQFYYDDEVAMLGSGSWRVGSMVIAQNAVTGPLFGHWRAFNDDLPSLHDRASGE